MSTTKRKEEREKETVKKTDENWSLPNQQQMENRHMYSDYTKEKLLVLTTQTDKTVIRETKLCYRLKPADKKNSR